jgi:hypothetical protein
VDKPSQCDVLHRRQSATRISGRAHRASDHSVNDHRARSIPSRDAGFAVRNRLSPNKSSSCASSRRSQCGDSRSLKVIGSWQFRIWVIVLRAGASQGANSKRSCVRTWRDARARRTSVASSKPGRAENTRTVSQRVIRVSRMIRSTCWAVRRAALS